MRECQFVKYPKRGTAEQRGGSGSVPLGSEFCSSADPSDDPHSPSHPHPAPLDPRPRSASRPVRVLPPKLRRSGAGARTRALAPLQPHTVLFSSTALTSLLLISNPAQLTRILAALITTSQGRAALSVIQNLFFRHFNLEYKLIRLLINFPLSREPMKHACLPNLFLN